MTTSIKIENLSKQYRLGLVSTRTLSHDLNRWYQMNLLGKDDPYLKIGEANERTTHGNSEYIWALKDINLEVKQGEVLGIIGKNGAGKSTLLKILSKVTTPTTGSINIKGKIASLLEVGTGFHYEMTGRENIYMNGAILGMNKAEISHKLDEIIDFAGIERYIDTPVKRYSSGMIVRLGFAVAAHLEPEILVVDEVLAVGDAEFQKKAIGKMQDISKGGGRTVLFVSHNMTAVKNLCIRGIILKDGAVYYSGIIDKVINKYIGQQEARSQIKISDIKDRFGNGILRFTHIDFLNIDGISKNIFEVGEEVFIRVSFVFLEELKKVTTSRIDIGINNIIDERVTWMSSFMYTDRINFEKNYVVFKIRRLLLNEGSYNVNLYCATNLGVADWIANVAKLKIVFHDFYKNGRIMPEHQGSFVTDFILV